MNQILRKIMAGRTLGCLFKDSLRRNNPHGYSYLNGKSLTILFLFVVNCTLANAQSTAKLIAFQANDVKLNASWILEREALNTTYIGSLDADRLLHNFRINARLPSTAKALEGWESPSIGLRGHFVGHYLSAVSMVIERYHEPVLSKRLEYMVTELAKCQQALGKGYLSAFPESDFEKLETKFTGVWAPYYTYHKVMQGLLDVYTHTGNQKALEIVNGMAGYVKLRMSRLDNQTIERMLYTVAANPENEPGAMNEVLYKLYRITKNPMHFELAKLFDRDWFLQPLSKNHDILSDLHANTHLVLVNGFAQRYRLSGEQAYHDAVLNFWNILEHDHTYVNGSSSGPRPNVTTPTSLSAEHWGLPGHLSNTMTKEIAESCVTHNTQKLTAELFTWTGKPTYADAYMNAFYNAVLPTQNDQNGTCVYHLPLGSPRTKFFLKENDFRCCNGTAIEAFAGLNANIYFKDSSSLWINQYIPSRLNWREKKLTLNQTGNFPKDKEVLFSFSAEKDIRLTVNLFVPSWANELKIYVNGRLQSQTAVANSFVRLDRVWRNKDQIKLVFDYRFRIERMQDDMNKVAFFYGPTLLAFVTDTELALRSKPEQLLTNLSIIDSASFQLKDGKHVYTLRPFYGISKTSYGVYASIREY
ncbi:glycoside hydrolase family 127 protein [Pedobacter sp. ISL-68]|uniref:beta-L-arabinofuranosidase domain-containing protein n=1 Tax=unclassified Pedobacter TaxID=2628915 RepID=UPI001BE76EE7|nr:MULTISPECIES: beta-L-arabinofuranosidase domain-containing protein [unclassified Pedobacter]MBT2560929.1 glycoside hydrolase family 127 protein [Pedobacter sp. ISL-64]MBT2590319.1 glycoside hydrolase family 127 protein [Pedobacter sp. ISL-68]